MKIVRVRSFVVKLPYHDRFGGQTKAAAAFPGSDYYFEDDWREVYANRTQTVLVRVDTEEGVYGWGESQAPIVPEAAHSVIEHLLGPMLLGEDPRQVERLWDRMYRSMNARGHWTGFMIDALSGLDIALWDIKAKAAGEPLVRLLGGPLRDHLPAYVSGIRAATDEARAELAAEHFAAGYAAVKLYMGHGVEADVAQATAVRQGVGPRARLLADVFWVYSLQEAITLGRELENLGVEWLEAPLQPEDVAGHAALARELRMSVAIGEPLRSRFQFARWLAQDALDIAQPDIARCGITEGRRIAELAAAHHRRVALHLGVCLGVGMAATWQLSAALPTFYIQEHQPPMLDLSNRLLTAPLQMDRDGLVVPAVPGHGADVGLDELAPYITRHADIRGHRG
jgi:L-alanine-DL-glutamate epimerase-like enolase superfamily enzyme